MMKRWIAAVCVLCPGFVFAGSYVSAVTSNPVPVVAATVATEVTFLAWEAETAYAVGNVADLGNGNRAPAVVVAAGTSGSSAPVWNASADITDGTVTWRPIHRGVRKTLVVSNLGTNTVYIDFRRTLTGGIPIGALQYFDFTSLPWCPQGRVYARTEGEATSSVSIVDNW